MWSREECPGMHAGTDIAMLAKLSCMLHAHDCVQSTTCVDMVVKGLGHVEL